MSEKKIKGYVVRGKNGHVYTEATALTLDATVLVQGRTSLRFPDVRIFAVAEDGTETQLPTYEEALAERDVLRVVMLNGAPGDLVRAAKDGEEAYTEIVAERDKLRAENDRLRACPLAELVRGFRGDPANPESRGPVWSAFDRVVAAVPEDRRDAALVDAVEALGFALDVRLRQMRDALDARDAMIAEGPAS